MLVSPYVAAGIFSAFFWLQRGSVDRKGERKVEGAPMGDVVCCRQNTRQNSANSKHAASTPSCFLPPLELLPSTPLLMQHPRRHLINYFLLHLAPSTAFLPGPSRCLTLLRGRIALSAVVPPDSGRQYCSTSSSRATAAAHPW